MDASPSSLCLLQISPASDYWQHILHQFATSAAATLSRINLCNHNEQHPLRRKSDEDIPDVLARLCDYVAVAVNAHAHELFSQSHASQAQASPAQLAQSQAAALTNGFAQHEAVVCGDFALGNFTALVAQPHDPHKHVSQVQVPAQFGHRQSTQPQPEDFALSRFEFAKLNAPAHASVAAARTAGIENVFMVLLAMKMDRKRNESLKVSVRFVQFSHLQSRASNEGP